MLVFGKYGQVAHCLRDEAGTIELTSLGSDDCNLMTPGAGADAVRGAGADIVVNAAAFTAVDKAETERAAAQRLNAGAPAELAAAAHASGACFFHLSTDYIFDGIAENRYDERAATAPLNVYGKTKHDGETAVLAAAPDAIIIRTSWVFSEYGSNFVKTMLRLGATSTLPIVDDQIGGPTPARDIARAIIAIASKRHCGAAGAGVYHFQGTPAVSWAEFAEAVFAEADLNVSVRRIPTSEYPTPADRPLHTVLDCARIERDFGVSQPDWRAGLHEVIGALRGKPRKP